MILSEELLLSDKQAIVATAPSTNVIDLGVPGSPHRSNAVAQDVGKGEPLHILIQVAQAFNNLTTLAVSLQVDDDAAFGSPKTLNTETIPLAELVEGKRTFMQFVPNGADERYMRVNYTVIGGAPSAGQVTAGITAGNQTNT